MKGKSTGWKHVCYIYKFTWFHQYFCDVRTYWKKWTQNLINLIIFFSRVVSIIKIFQLINNFLAKYSITKSYNSFFCFAFYDILFCLEIEKKNYLRIERKKKSSLFCLRHKFSKSWPSSKFRIEIFDPPPLFRSI